MGSNEEHFTYAMQLVTSTSLTMVLSTTIKLKVLEAISEAGPDAQLSAHEIASRLLIPNQDAPDMIDRMLRLLASHSIVTCTQREHEQRPVRVYGLTPVAKYFIPNEDGVSLSPAIELYQDKVFIDSWFKLKDSVLEGGVAFNKVHGARVFEYTASDPRLSKIFNNAMVNNSTIVMKEILKSYKGFDNIKLLVDVGGGLGITLNMIISAYPTVKGINFDLPHVIKQAPPYSGINHVEGDMFQEIPQGEAIFMKSILHAWSDDNCIKILKNCYKALPSDGHVIVVDKIIPFLPGTSSFDKSITQRDALTMTQIPGGKERTDEEFLFLAKDAGFKGIEKKCFAGDFSVMEFYK